MTLGIDIGLVLTIISMLFGAFMAYRALKWERMARKYEPRVKQLMSMLGTDASNKRYAVRMDKKSEEAQGIVVKNIRSKIPLGLDKGLSDEHILSLLFNPEFVKGGLRIGGIVVKGLEALGIKMPFPRDDEPDAAGQHYTYESSAYEIRKVPEMKSIAKKK